MMFDDLRFRITPLQTSRPILPPFAASKNSCESLETTSEKRTRLRRISCSKKTSSRRLSPAPLLLLLHLRILPPSTQITMSGWRSSREMYTTQQLLQTPASTAFSMTKSSRPTQQTCHQITSFRPTLVTIQGLSSQPYTYHSGF